ncbi:MAG: FAD-dependent oxidoreductase [Planctomycetota bacterium]|jgi:hypothetical protein|nr:FAD-dependent oxidoreductase [Planctomycetota bacterium]
MPATDLLVLAATPGGIMSAIAAAEDGLSVAIIERSQHIGGLPANGLGATDIATRGATRGLFTRFTERVLAHYRSHYGPDSKQVADASAGYHFEPSVAEQVFTELLAEHPAITVYCGYQFDADPARVEMQGRRPRTITITELATGAEHSFSAQVFIDASYEGDLAAACGAPFRLGREGYDDLHEDMAGPLYQSWRHPYQRVGTGGDHRVQAYNYRLCLTSDPANRVTVTKPSAYNPAEYESLIGDLAKQSWTGITGPELHLEGIGRLTNMVVLPNSKTDANNQHLAFISTDLPEENQDWPTANWAWRDNFAQRLRSYICGLLYFAQNDERLPEDFRAACAQWGFAADEYQDNDHFPRQVYVREGRRIEGDHLFTAHDAKPIAEGLRPPVHSDSITASHYALDSHACRKREAGKPHLEGFLSTPCAAYTVPYGVMLPKAVEGLLTPVPASATHIGFSTLRMEPCWMALGEAAGVAAALSVHGGAAPRSIPVERIQARLLERGAVLVYIKDCDPADPRTPAIQRAALAGLIPDWEARLDEPAEAEQVRCWSAAAGRPAPAHAGRSRGEVLAKLFAT